MTDNNLALVLQLLLDEKTKAKTIKGINEVGDAVDNLGSGKGRSKKSQAVQVDTAETDVVVRNSKKRKAAYEDEAKALVKASRFDPRGGTVPSHATSLSGDVLQRDKVVMELMKSNSAKRIGIVEKEVEAVKDANGQLVESEEQKNARLKALSAQANDAWTANTKGGGEKIEQEVAAVTAASQKAATVIKDVWSATTPEQQKVLNEMNAITASLETVTDKAERAALQLERVRKSSELATLGGTHHGTQEQGLPFYQPGLGDNPAEPYAGEVDKIVTANDLLVESEEQKSARLRALAGNINDVWEGTTAAADKYIGRMEDWQIKSKANDQKMADELAKAISSMTAETIAIINSPEFQEAHQELMDLAGMKEFQAAFDQRFMTKDRQVINRQTGRKAQQSEITALQDEFELSQKTGAPIRTVEQISAALKEEADDQAAVNAEMRKMGAILGLNETQVQELTEDQHQFGLTVVESEENLKKMHAEMRKANREASVLMRTSQRLHQVGRTLQMAGVAVVGGAFAMAQREATRQQAEAQVEGGKAVDATTKKWLEDNRRIELSTQRISRVFEKEILPYLDKISAIAEKASKYLESHPEVAKGLLGAGAVAAAIGTAVSLAATGIRMVADFKYLAANAMFDLAERRFEKDVAAFATSVAGNKMGAGGAAARVGKGVLTAEGAATGGGLLGGATVASIAATVATLVATIAAGAILGTIVYDLIAKSLPKLGLPRFGAVAAGGANLFGKQVEKVAVAGGMEPAEAARKTLVLTYNVGRLFGAIKEGDPAWQSVVDGAKKAAGALDDLSKSEEELAKEAQGAKVVTDLQKDNIAAEKQYNADRARVLSDATNSLRAANENLFRANQATRAGLTKNLLDLATNFRAENTQAEKESQIERAKIVQQGGEEIKRIEQDVQDQLRQAAEEHAERESDLIDARDAKGLLDEQDAYAKQRDEIQDAGNKEIMLKRRDLAIQLHDLTVSENQQRAVRLAQYKQAVIDAQAQAKQEFAQNFAARAEAVRQTNAQRIQALIDLDRQYRDERLKRIQAAQAAIMDLGLEKNAERNLLNRMHQITLADAEAWSVRYRQTLASGLQSSVTAKSTKGLVKGGENPTFASGGYVPSGLIQSHAGEFMANESTTKYLEGLVGGRLTQNNLRGLGQGGGVAVTWNDHRTFAGEWTPAMREANRKDTLDLIEELVRPDA